MNTLPIRRLSLRLPAAAILLATLSSAGTGQVIDPDPEIFDGTRTKSKAQQIEKDTTIDDWEKGNIIVYDTKGEGSAEGGQGRVGGKGPGYEIGSPDGINVGLPLPIGGGGDATQGQSGGMPPIAASSGESTPGTNGSPQGQAPKGKPSQVGIGDPNAKIKTTTIAAQAGTEGPEKTGEGNADARGTEDTTQMPDTASGGQQSAPRKGGVEKGDAMPTDI